MINRPDLDQADSDSRAVLRARLKEIRKTTVGVQAEARIISQAAGLGVRFVEDCEAAPQWGAQRVARWARLLGHRFTMTITGLDLPELDFDAELLRMAVPFGGLDEDTLHLLAVVDDLARYRIHTGLTYAEIGRRTGSDGSAVRGWEDQPAKLLLKTVQRYTRALGGALLLDVVPANAAVSA